MFDFAWSEFVLIGVVALIAIGPKDLPIAIKAVTGMIKKARGMAAEFQTHVDEMVRDADLKDVRDQINQLRSFDIKNEIKKAVDADGTLESTLTSNPLAPDYTAPAWETPVIATAAEPESEPPPEVYHDGPVDPALLAVPAFVPPEIASPPVPPAYIPPGITLT